MENLTTKLNTAFIALLLILAAHPALAAPPSPNYQVTATFPLGGPGGFDYATIDDAGKFLYLPRSTHTMVVDTATGKVVGDIPGSALNHGVALVPALNRGFISDGKNANVLLFDIKTNSPLGTVPAAVDADGIIFDPATNHIFVACGDANSLVVLAPDVAPNTGKPEAVIDLGGKPEFLAADGQGKVYVNLTDKAQVAVIDAKTLKLLTKWSIAPGARATGMAMDREKGRLFIGGRNQHFIVMNAKDGSILADLPIGAGVDATAFNAGTAMASCADGTLAIVQETAPNKFEIVQTVKTAPSAKTMALDPNTGKVYLPCADQGITPPATRPAAVPNTFKVLVVQNK